MEDQALFLGHISYNINQSRRFLGHISCKLIDLIVLLEVATREAMLRSLYLSILVCLRWTKQINLLFSLWQIIHSYLWTFQYIHVRNSLYVFYILFLVTEMSCRLLCPLRIGKRRRKGQSLFKVCCCPPFLMIFYEEKTMVDNDASMVLKFTATEPRLQSMVCL